jgi:serine-type D-Ala-D-Ala carboxypeptidase/endopeptidase
MMRRAPVALDTKILEAYVGQYQLTTEFVIEVTRGGDKLYAQATGQPKIELFAESETEFSSRS